jgi:hypothetical protein
MLRPSFVPPPAIRELRDLTRYRVDLLAVRTAEKQRVEKLLEDALIKLSVVVSDPFGAWSRAVMAALIAGERDPAVLAELDRGRLRAYTDRLTEAPTCRFIEHHASLLIQLLQRIDGVTADIAIVQDRMDAQLGESAPAVARLDAIRGVGAGRRADDLGCDRHRYGPIPDPGASDLPTSRPSSSTSARTTPPPASTPNAESATTSGATSTQLQRHSQPSGLTRGIRDSRIRRPWHGTTKRAQSRDGRARGQELVPGIPGRLHRPLPRRQ